MFKKIIPCLCLLLPAAYPPAMAQTNVPDGYSESSNIIFKGEKALTSQAQTRLYLSPASENGIATEEMVLEEINNSIEHLKRQKVQRKRRSKALQMIRHEIESKYLRSYQGLADFSDLFKYGRYNDITAAALTSMLLKELRIDHNLYLFQQQPRIELADGAPLEIEHWGHNRPSSAAAAEEQSRLIEVLNALQVQPESPFYRSILESYRSGAEKRELLPAELTGMLYYRRALDFYAKKQLPAALAALEMARTYRNDAKLDLVRYAILFQQAAVVRPDSASVGPLFELYRLHPTAEISQELMRRFARLAEYFLLQKNDSYSFEKLYADYRDAFSGKPFILQQLKEIYFIEMARFSARKYEPQRVIAWLDSLNTYRPNDRQIQQILTPLLVQSLSNQKDPEKGLPLLESYRRDFPFLQSDLLFKDIDLCYRAERVRRAFDGDREVQARSYLEAFEQHLAQAGLTPRCKLWITTAYYAGSAYYFRNADYVNARWYIQRALALVPDDQFLLHRQEVLKNY